MSQSPTQTPAHTPYGAADKHTHTHVSVHRPAHLCRTPPILQYTASVLLQFVCRIVGGWSFVCCLGERSEGERQMERRSEEKGGDGGVGWSSAGQGHCVDDLLQLAPQSLSPRLLVPLQRRQDLILVLDNVGVDLM